MSTAHGNYDRGYDRNVISEPHILFAEVSLDISRGEYQAGLEKLIPFAAPLGGSYLYCLLYGKAQKGLNNRALAGEYLKKCCVLAPANQIAWNELRELQILHRCDEQHSLAPLFDPVADELDKLSSALMDFQPVNTTENADPTPINEQKQPFSDDTAIAVPTETLASLFTAQGAYKKAIKIYSLLIQLKPQSAEHYQNKIDQLLEKL
ncbi:MAG: hypothetical protein WCH05_02540 [Chlorobiaceae bacterium]